MIRGNKTWTGARVRVGRKAGETKYVYTKATIDDFLFPLSGPAPTLVTNGDVRWWWREPNGKSKFVKMSVHEVALLQTFTGDYKWPHDAKLARQLIGNAVPPLVAELLLG